MSRTIEQSIQSTSTYKKPGRLESLKRDLKKNKGIYLMAIPVLLHYIIFCYIPIYGAQIAFKDFNPRLGIVGSPWAGLKHFRDFFGGIYFWRTFRNTLLISLYSIIFVFPSSIILALLLNELQNEKFKRTVQTVSYLPHFISLVVVCGMIREFTASSGVINDIIQLFGGTRKTMLLDPKLFRKIFITSEIWQSIGWGSIIYLATLSGIDPTYYEAATIDGAGRFRQLLHVTLPGLKSTIMILLILRIGQVMNVSRDKIILLYNPNIYETADVISSYVYRKGLLEQSYSYSAAVGLFNSVVNFIFVYTANRISRKVNEQSLW